MPSGRVPIIVQVAELKVDVKRVPLGRPSMPFEVIVMLPAPKVPPFAKDPPLLSAPVTICTVPRLSPATGPPLSPVTPISGDENVKPEVEPVTEPPWLAKSILLAKANTGKVRTKAASKAIRLITTLLGRRDNPIDEVAEPELCIPSSKVKQT